MTPFNHRAEQWEIGAKNPGGVCWKLLDFADQDGLSGLMQQTYNWFETTQFSFVFVMYKTVIHSMWITL